MSYVHAMPSSHCPLSRQGPPSVGSASGPASEMLPPVPPPPPEPPVSAPSGPPSGEKGVAAVAAQPAPIAETPSASVAIADAASVAVIHPSFMKADPFLSVAGSPGLWHHPARTVTSDRLTRNELTWL